MAELVMLDLDPGDRLVDEIRRAWDDGDAIFPLDRRLPPAEARRVVDVIAPTAIVDGDGRRTLDGGRAVEAGDAIVVATSGTTGLPKAVIHTHASVRASAVATSAGLGADPRSDTWLACLPPAHIGGLAVIMRSLVTDTPLVVLPAFEAEAVERAATAGATLVSLVTRALSQVDHTRFRKILIGGAAPPPDRPDNVIATYGMTETGSGCVYEGYALDGVEMRATEQGEIEVRGPMLLRAYRTADGDVSPLDDDGWFGTGDIGRIEPDGRLWIEGRAGEMIVTGGENVWPTRAERTLERHPAIAEAAIVGRPDAEWGARVCAVVVVADGHDPPTLAEVREHVRAELPVWYAPKDLAITDALPRTPFGKVRRSDL